MTGLIWIAAYLSVPALALIRNVIAAPLGWQDEDGFHYGREPDSNHFPNHSHDGAMQHD